MAEPFPQQAITLIQQFESCHRTSDVDDLIHAYPDPSAAAPPGRSAGAQLPPSQWTAVGSNDAISRDVADSIFVAHLQAGYWQPLAEQAAIRDRLGERLAQLAEVEPS